jgi:hypothetical protein
MGGGASKREDGLQRLKKIKARIDSGDLDGALAECDAVQEAMLVNKRLAAIAVPLGELRAEAKRLLDRHQVQSETNQTPTLRASTSPAPLSATGRA